ncbi:MAG: cation:dicarboxylase symporter family transporter [Clostridiales bacterium]|jgi:L-cystine uptake protein TcyP (sodium:dicarboxylate symporter family)|nr:cation:dicarboxylase symporter family transporter [Clostridiales bacterium]
MKPDGSLTTASLLFAIGIIVLFAGATVGLVFLKKLRVGKRGEDGKRKKISFGLVMLAALVFGTVFGLFLKLLWSSDIYLAFGVNAALEWVNIVQELFLAALQLVVVPLVIVSIIRAFVKVGASKDAARGGLWIMAALLFTVAVSGAVGYFAVKLFGLNASGLGDPVEKIGNTPTTIINTVTGIVPTNFFKALTSNNALPIVFLGILIAAAIVMVKKYDKEKAVKAQNAIEVLYEIVGTVVDIVIKFTPYGILSMVAVQIAINDWSVFVTLGGFIAAFYAGIAVIAALHILLLLVFGVNLKNYFKKTAKTYLFALTSMSSIATVPLTIKCQRDMGVSDTTANLAGSLGTCVGQNACAGLYPAMLVVLAAMYSGIDPWTVEFAVKLVLFTAISSIGVAGVGGGNIQASLLLLAMFGLPFNLITLFLGIDFIVGFARPPINAGDSIVAGVVAQRINDLTRARRNRKRARLGLPPLPPEVSENLEAGANI